MRQSNSIMAEIKSFVQDLSNCCCSRCTPVCIYHPARSVPDFDEYQYVRSWKREHESSRIRRATHRPTNAHSRCACAHERTRTQDVVRKISNIPALTASWDQSQCSLLEFQGNRTFRYVRRPRFEVDYMYSTPFHIWNSLRSTDHG